MKKIQQKLFRKKNYNYADHPDHYNIEGRKECWDEMEDILGSEAVYWWCLGSIYKYIYRKGSKPGEPAEREKEKIYAYMAKANELMEREQIIPPDLEKFMDIVRKEVGIDASRETK